MQGTVSGPRKLTLSNIGYHIRRRQNPQANGTAYEITCGLSENGGEAGNK
jgi:hypothetical protein